MKVTKITLDAFSTLCNKSIPAKVTINHKTKMATTTKKKKPIIPHIQTMIDKTPLTNIPALQCRVMTVVLMHPQPYGFGMLSFNLN